MQKPQAVTRIRRLPLATDSRPFRERAELALEAALDLERLIAGVSARYAMCDEQDDQMLAYLRAIRKAYRQLKENAVLLYEEDE